MRSWLTISLLLLAAGAGLLRYPQLARRPMHTDESVHALKFKELLEQGRYVYDPNEFHGPALYYLTLPWVRWSAGRDFAQTTETHYRMVPLGFGVGLIVLLGLVGRGLGKGATLFAGLLTAISPAMVFYSRYYIHEMLLVFFTFLCVAATWRYLQSRNPGWCVLGGLSFGLGFATKETWVLVVMAMIAASVANEIWIRRVERDPTPGRAWPLCGAHLVLTLGVALITAVVLFSSFFTNAGGPVDSLRTYLPWTQRAEGQSPHVHPFGYYLGLLTWFHRPPGPVFTEGFILCLAVAGLLGALVWPKRLPGNPRFIRWLGFFSVLLTLAYSVIPYKTPWCFLGFYHGLILLAGVGIVFLWQVVSGITVCRTEGTEAADSSKLPLPPAAARRGWLMLTRRAGYALGLVAGGAHLLWQVYLANFPYCADPKNPYVYAHTLPDVLRLSHTIEQVALASSARQDLAMKIIVPGGDYWPLPWYLRQFRNAEFWTQIPEPVAAPVVVSSPRLDEVLEPKLKGTHVPAGYYAHRPGKRQGVFLELYVELDTWAAYLKTRPPVGDPDE